MKKDDVIIFAFKNTVASKVLKKLNFPNKFFIGSDKESIDNFISTLRPSIKVLGLGQYTGRDDDKLRLETLCNNKFRNTKLKKPILRIRSFLKPQLNSKYAEGLGNSFCNLVSLEIINSRESNYAFIHISKHFDSDLATEEIESMISAVR